MNRTLTRWYVARVRPWPDCVPMVQVSDDFEKMDPGLLADGWGDDRSEYAQLTDAYDDPRNAVTAAIRMRDLWQSEVGNDETVVLSIAPGPSWVPSESSEADVVTWADNAWNALPACDYCGHKGLAEQYECEGLQVNACSAEHATMYAWQCLDDEEEL